MNELQEFDYCISKKPEGKYRLCRILMVLGYVAFALAFFFGLYAMHLYQFIAFIVLVEWIVVFFTWRYVSIEYRYEMLSGRIKFFIIYGGRTKKLVLDARIKDYETIAPCDAATQTELEKQSFESVYRFISTERSYEDRYYAIFKNDSGNDCIVYFEATQKALKILKFYNMNTVVTDTRY